MLRISLSKVATLRFDVVQRNSSSTLGVFVNGLSDELGNSLAVSYATDVGGVPFVQGPTGPIPKPSTLLMMGTGLAGLIAWAVEQDYGW